MSAETRCKRQSLFLKKRYIPAFYAAFYNGLRLIPIKAKV